MILALKVSAFALAAALIICGMDRNSPEITARHEQLAWEKKVDVKPEDRFALRYLALCDATVATKIHYYENPMPGCYVRGER